jgi:hypothetical protein
MKTVSFIVILFVLCCTAWASGVDPKAGKAGDQLASEIEAKLANGSQAKVKASAHDCKLHIEFSAHNVSFDLPLQGTEVSTIVGTEDSLFVSNPRMTRTIRDRGPETFEKLMLRFGRETISDIKTVFDQAIRSCGA